MNQLNTAVRTIQTENKVPAWFLLRSDYRFFPSPKVLFAFPEFNKT